MHEKLTVENAIEAIKNIILEKIPEKKAIVFGYSMGIFIIMNSKFSSFLRRSSCNEICTCSS
jgi:hypothetical protein